MVRCAIASSASFFSLFCLRTRTETDSLEFSELGTNFEEAQIFRAITLNRVHMYLSLDFTAPDQETDSGQTVARRSILEQFDPVGRAMVKHYTLGKRLLNDQDDNAVANTSSTEQRRRLMQQIKFFVDMSELEQRVRLSGHLPTVESHLRRRMGTSAVAVCLAIHE